VPLSDSPVYVGGREGDAADRPIEINSESPDKRRGCKKYCNPFAKVR